MTYITEKLKEIEEKISNRPCQSYCELTDTCLLEDIASNSVNFEALGNIAIPETRVELTGNPNAVVTYQQRLDNSVFYARGFLNGLFEAARGESGEPNVQEEISYEPEGKLIYGRCENMPVIGSFGVGTTATVHISNGLVSHEVYAYDDNGEEVRLQVLEY